MTSDTNIFEYILGIHIPLPNSLIHTVDKIKKEAQIEYQSNYNFTPHITLHIAKCSKQEFERLVKVLQATNYRPFSIQLEKLIQTPTRISDELFYAIGVQKTPELLALHTDIVTESQMILTDPIRTKDQKRIQEGWYSAEEIKRIQTYGYSRVLDFFDPHITLGTSKERSVLDKIQKACTQLDFDTPYTIDTLMIGLYAYNSSLGKYENGAHDLLVTINFT